jgi:hypothetical protein
MKTNRACAALSMLLVAANVCLAEGKWAFPVGLSYVSGIQNVLDYYEELFPELDTSWSVPVGLSFTPYYEFEHGSRLSFDLGPAAIILIDEESYYGNSWESSEETYWDVPVGLTYGFTFLPQASVSPFARVGFKYHIADGDYVDSSTPGAFGAVGIEFMRNKMVGVSFEVGYDASEVTLAGADWRGNGYREEDVKSGEVLVSLRAVF